MKVLRIILVTLLALVAMVAGLFTFAALAVVFVVVGLVAYLVLLLKHNGLSHSRPGSRPAPSRRESSPGGDFIEVETNEVQEAAVSKDKRLT